MKQIIEILKGDLRRCRQSAIGVIVLVGLVIVPVLYAWFNIAGSWDPYGNTGNLKVAVANADTGYKSDLVPVEVNLGDSVTSALRENDQLGWEFVSKDEAIEGVESGAYYAAVVIPEDFSAKMMTLFSPEVEHATIVYYENQKASAIAPRVTDKGAATVRQQIDETFTETVGDVGLATASGLLDFMNGDEVANFVSHLSSTLGTGASSLRDAAAGMGSVSGLVGSTSDLLTSAAGMLETARGGNDRGADLLADAQAGVDGLTTAFDGVAATVNQALDDSANSFTQVEQAVDDAFANASDHVSLTVSQLTDAAASVAADAEDTRAWEADIRYLTTKVGDLPLSDAEKQKLKDDIAALADSIGGIASQQEQVAAQLTAAATALSEGTADTQKSYQEVKDLLAQAKDSLEGVRGDYENTLKGEIDDLGSTADGIADASAGIAESLDETVAGLATASNSLAGDLAGINGVLTGATGDLTSAADDLQRIKDSLDQAALTGDMQQIRDLIGSDPAALANALAAPVALDRTPVYHIENYGSAMAPFYTILSLWVGGIVLAAMLKVDVDEALVPGGATLRPHQRYWGRFALFALLSLCQSTLVCAGDLLFFGIQCQHPFQFIVVGWLAGFVFCNMIYTLTVSFGDVGKALAVVLLVMQVAGSGGTFPIEMTADFFQAVYPFLPFTHAINAMHAAMAGAYGMEYWTELGLLASYLVPSLALGLVLRRPVMRANAWVSEQLESTKLM